MTNSKFDYQNYSFKVYTKETFATLIEEIVNNYNEFKKNNFKDCDNFKDVKQYNILKRKIIMDWKIVDNHLEMTFVGCFKKPSLDDLKLFEDLRQLGVFKKAFGKDFPDTMQLYTKNKVTTFALMFTLDANVKREYWNKELEEKKLLEDLEQNATRKQKLQMLLDKRGFQARLDKKLPRTYKNLNVTLKDKTYLDIIDIDLVNIKKEIPEK